MLRTCFTFFCLIARIRLQLVTRSQNSSTLVDLTILIVHFKIPVARFSVLSIMIIFNNTSAEFVLISADVLLKMITILKEMRITQLCSFKWTDFSDKLLLDIQLIHSFMPNLILKPWMVSNTQGHDWTVENFTTAHVV